MVCDNILVLDANVDYKELINKTCKNVRIWSAEEKGDKVVVYFNSSNVPMRDKLNMQYDFTWSYYFEEGSFLCVGYFVIRAGEIQKTVSWNNANIGKLTDDDSAYAKKFLRNVYPQKAKEIFVG